jgi:hypothetical protein
MKFKIFIALAMFNFQCALTQNQVNNFKEKFELPDEVKETSGLLFLDGKIITHNDSGDAPNLYEIDSLSGTILRTVTISNATNVDWEDLAENDTHIFIADIGNNNENQILKIMRLFLRKLSPILMKIKQTFLVNQIALTLMLKELLCMEMIF